MEPDAFIAEIYRRMNQRHYGGAVREVPWQEARRHPMVRSTMRRYRSHLPADREAPILDIGFGSGWFIAACIELGYQNIFGAEFGGRKQYLRQWSPAVQEIIKIESSIGDMLKGKAESFEFIHLSHVIEHIPKYSLLYLCDALYLALRKGGTLLVRTPNMEGPCPTSSLFVTLSHEYGFGGLQPEVVAGGLQF